MTGREMYDRWAAFMAHEGVGVDEWYQLDDADQKAWMKLAIEVGGDA